MISTTRKKTLPRAVLSAIAVVIVVYVIVTLGTVMLIGAVQVVQHKEVSLDHKNAAGLRVITGFGALAAAAASVALIVRLISILF